MTPFRAIATSALAGAAACAAALALGACGGGGGGTAAPPPKPSPSPSAGCAAAMWQSHPAGYAMRFPEHELGEGADVIPGVVAVRFAQRDSLRFTAAAKALGGSVRTALDSRGTGTIALPAGVDTQKAVLAARSLSGVVASGPLLMRSKLDVVPNDQFFGTLPYSVPNPSSNNPPLQWDMYKMSMPAAWGQATGFGSSGVKIAIIDTGYDMTNPDLAPLASARVAASVVYDLGNGMQDTSATAQDHDGHGTDVTGIAGADTNNGTDVAGVSGKVTFLEARVFPNPTAANQCPGANTQDVGAAIHWAINNGANVISMSLGGAHPDTMFEEPAVSDAIAAGVVVVAAAGNDGKAQLDYPAADPHVIAAGASSLDDSANPRNYGAAVERVASYSNYITNAGAGEYYVVAPGGDPNAAQGNCTQRSCIDFLQWITNLYSNTAFSNAGEVVLIAGTSMSTPHIAGLAALMLDKDPGLTPDQVATIISTNTVDIGDPKQGHGRVDAVQALNATP